MNITAIKLIDQLIKQNQLKMMRKWSLRYRREISGDLSHTIRKLVGKIRQLLKILSGDDVIEMLKGF